MLSKVTGNTLKFEGLALHIPINRLVQMEEELVPKSIGSWNILEYNYIIISLLYLSLERMFALTIPLFLFHLLRGTLK